MVDCRADVGSRTRPCATGTGRARPGLAVVGQDWPRLDHNKALEVRFIMVLAVFSGGMGNQGSQAPHGFLGLFRPLG